MKFLISFALLAASLLGQPQGPITTRSDGPAGDWHSKRYYAPTSTTFYICYARPVRSTVAQTGISNAASAVFTVSGGHGLSLYSVPVMTITGGTGLWVGVNGVYQATIIDSTTFSIPVDSTLFSTITGTVVVTTTAPRENQPIWSVKKIQSDSSGNPLAELWAVGGASNVCSSPATLSYQ